MHVPRSWCKAEGELELERGEKQPLAVWGWGDDEAEARGRAGERLRRLIERWKGDAPERGEYDYAERPLREEILQVVDERAVLTLDREFEPASDETRTLMERTGTDPAFARLCRVQKSFRARLTPKPWRCACPNPPGEHPRAEGKPRERFAAWCERYARAAERFATCRYVETVGNQASRPELAPLIELHDQASRCGVDLPLA